MAKYEICTKNTHHYRYHKHINQETGKVTCIKIAREGFPAQVQEILTEEFESVNSQTTSLTFNESAIPIEILSILQKREKK